MTSHKLKTLEELVPLRAELRKSGRKLVFTDGCFDLLHVGHVRTLQRARSLGDALVVAINSDRSVREIKGPARPVMPEAERAEILSALEPVDFVVVFDEATPEAVIDALVPDVLAKGADCGPESIVGRERVEGSGGRVCRIPLVEGVSTTDIVQRVLERFG
ncbi:MAG: D-glycero-beta-D-manno-heptose 1-phosphate adenylyltransferase [Acidobacteria bacterium]|nr:D-glycero-beta-D-manno-heptose 1-phosphate adenylyltransferase [Acidobacteriota bacterium]